MREEEKFQGQFTVQYMDPGQKQIIAVQSHLGQLWKTTEKNILSSG